MSATPLLSRIRALSEGAPSGLPVALHTLTEIEARGGERLPILGLVLGDAPPDAPTLVITGGVHGLERIGAEVAVAYLEHLVARASWDTELRARLSRVRVLALPLANPGGFAAATRSNPRGVDLMRNAPVEAVGRSKVGLAGGHRLTPLLPWYRGRAGAPLEVEAKAYVDFVEREAFGARRALLIDCHSGFGFRDRLWYPYAKTKEPFPRVGEAAALGRLLDATYPQHAYVIEPQSVSYTTHGDLLDHLFDRHRASHPDVLFIPWTLEMGSWRWIRQRPWQLRSLLGWFNPSAPHLRQRVWRQHLFLFDFLLAALESPAAWAA